MADVACELGPTVALSFGSGQVWPGAVQFRSTVRRFENGWKRHIDLLLAPISGTKHILWVCKGIAPLDKLVRHVQRHHPDTIIILDVDDDDWSLAREFAAASKSNSLRLHPLRRGSSWRIRRSQEEIRQGSHGFTFSTNVLASTGYERFRPYVRIPHVRALDRRDSDQGPSGKSYGCFGTLRPHKGGQMLIDFMRSNRDWNLVTFANCGLEPKTIADSNWHEIPADTPLTKAYREIDIALLPITSKSLGAQLQLPAKLVDAMKAGKPVVATSTPAIAEILGQDFLALPDEASPDIVRALMESAAISDLGERGRARFEASLTPQVVAKELHSFVNSIIESR
jgi:glycosyltransferase involved in cell wall biosynthesis